MADPLVTPALVGYGVTAQLKKVMKDANLAYSYRDKCNELVDRLVKIEPIIKKLGRSSSMTKNEECRKWLMHFSGLLVRAEVLTKECLQESRFDKTKRVLKFWDWKKLPSHLRKINIKIDKAIADANLIMLDMAPSTTARESLGFVKQATPSLIVGVEEQFNALKTSILQCSRREDKPSTFGLHGRGGAGKTLLAQMLNNDNDIKETYGEDSIIWITVGLDASVGDLYERLGKSTILDCDDSKNLKLLHKEDQRTFLKNAFAEKKILLILDDVWEKQYDNHDMMYWLDVVKAPGSTMLITSQNETTLCKACAEVRVVRSLDNDDSWKLFCFHAFVNRVATFTTIPEELARDICEECKGLPLALKVIGDTMMDKVTVREWELALCDLRRSTPILDSFMDCELFDRLQLCYKELKDDASKICFLYFAAFLEDHKIEVKDLINIWVGEELFGSNLDTKEAENRAYAHLGLLVKRSLIDWNQEDNSAHIHDILRDLALSIIDNAKLGECAHECLFHSEKTSISFPGRKCVVGLKRMSFVNCNISHWPDDLQIACGEVKVCILQNTTIVENRASLDFFNNMTNLRVLDLSRNSFISQGRLASITKLRHLTKLNLSSCHSFNKLPKRIGNLKCLTNLDLSDCGSLTGLPESIGNLECLTKLDLSDCGSLTGLPESIGNLKCLTKLDLSDCGSLTGLPESIGNLKCLTNLDLSDCGSLIGLPESIGNLKCLTNLDLSDCGSLTGLPANIGNLECLTISEISQRLPHDREQFEQAEEDVEQSEQENVKEQSEQETAKKKQEQAEIVKEQQGQENVKDQWEQENVEEHREQEIVKEQQEQEIAKEQHEQGEIVKEQQEQEIAKEQHEQGEIVKEQQEQEIAKEQHEQGEIVKEQQEQEIAKEQHEQGEIVKEQQEQEIAKEQHEQGEIVKEQQEHEIAKEQHEQGEIVKEQQEHEIAKEQHEQGEIVKEQQEHEIAKEQHEQGEIVKEQQEQEIAKEQHEQGEIVKEQQEHEIAKEQHEQGEIVKEQQEHEIAKEQHEQGEIVKEQQEHEIAKEQHEQAEVVKEQQSEQDMQLEQLGKGLVMNRRGGVPVEEGRRPWPGSKHFYNFLVIFFILLEPLSNTVAFLINHGRFALGLLVIWFQIRAGTSDQVPLCYKRRVKSKDLILGRFLGQGCSGIFYETTWPGLHESTGKLARKLFPGVQSDVFEREVVPLVALNDHPNVIKTFCWTIDKKSCSVVMEYVRDNLSSVVRKRKEALRKGHAASNQYLIGTSSAPFRLLEAMDIVLQIANGIQHLHSNDITHGDLKPNNILIDEEKMLVKLADFGLIETKRRTTLVSQRTLCSQMVEWSAPELVEDYIGFTSEDLNSVGIEHDAHASSVSCDKNRREILMKKTDSYSFALICVYVLGGKTWDANLRPDELRKQISCSNLRPELPSACPEALASLISMCWSAEPTRRPTFSVICNKLEEIVGELKQQSEEAYYWANLYEVKNRKSATETGQTWLQT